MKLISLKDQNLDGSRKLKKGEPFEMSESSARFLIATKRAKPDVDEPTEKRKTYHRRDMRAED